MRILAAAVLLCAAAAPAPAATWLVPSQAPTIAAGLDSAAAGDTVLVACGTYAESGLVLGAGVTLRSATGLPDCVTVDGSGAGRILECVGPGDPPRLEGFTFTGGATPPGATLYFQSGGALRATGSDVAVADCVFRFNSGKFGAAVAVHGGAPSFVRCDFDSNAASGTDWATGGGLYCEDASPALDDCVFTGNTAFAVQLPGDGGAVFSRRCNVLATDCVFTGNASGAGAGAFYSFFNDESVLERCTFVDNTSAAGGAMYVENSFPVLRDCRFERNVAENGGAAFLGEYSGPTFTACVFDSNHATPNSGGAVDVWFSTADFLDCDFLDNRADLRGGAVSVNVLSGPTFTDCHFARNRAQDGGAVRLTGTGTALFTTCNLVGNLATASGGGVYADGSSLALLQRSLIVFGTGGGAVECGGSGSVSLTDCDLFGNAGGDWTGCIAGQAGSGGNFSADPLFCNAGADEWTLTLPDSPALAQNHSSGQRIGPEIGGCGCPAGATILVPADQPTIAAAMAAAVPGDIIGVCDGTWTETVDLVSGVHLRGVRADLVTVGPGASPDAVLRASGVSDSTFVEEITFDGGGLVTQTVLAESLSTALHLRSCRITGGAVAGITNGPDSRVTLGGTLATANDLFANGTGAPFHLQNLNVAGDSLDATLNWWGTTRYDSILAAIQGPVRSCPITNEAHADSLCAPLSAVPAPTVPGASAGPALSAFPNPFSGAAVVRLALPRPGDIRLTVHDVRGRRVATLAAGPRPAGAHAVAWTGRGADGRPVAPGVYFLRLEAAGAVATARIVRLR